MHAQIDVFCMKSLNEFKIPFVGLKKGKHQFDFQIENKFFDAFEYDEFEKVNFKITLELDKKETFLELEFFAKGYVNVPCDITGDDFDLQVEGQCPLLVKFGETYDNSDEDLLILPHNAYQVDVAQYIYELIVLSIPQKRINPNAVFDEEIEDAEEFEKELKKKEQKQEQVDPRWDQLKQLLDKK